MLMMAATPLAMVKEYGHTFVDSAFIAQWHMFGMFAPSFFTGSLIKRFGAIVIIITGIFINLFCIIINLSGNDVLNFWMALFLLGIGWNFMFVSGTTMVTETYHPSEKAIVQGVNDFFVFGSAAFASLLAGVLQTSIGWEAINFCAIFLLTIVIVALIWYFFVLSYSKKLTTI